MARRRGNNEGSMYQRKDGLWCAQVSLEGRRLTKYEKMQKDCRAWIKETLKKIDGGLTFEGTQVTLERFVETWMDGKELARRSATVEQYRQICRQHILPTMGRMRLQEIQPANIKHLYMTKKEEGRGPRTVQLIHTILHNILQQAVREGILGRNPVEAVERPKVEKTEMKILTEEQARRFIISTMRNRYGMLFYLALMTGMRQGELLGLKWADLDWDKGLLNVQRQLQRARGHSPQLVAPKTQAGRRQIKLGPGTLERLGKHKIEQAEMRSARGARWEENDLIFPNTLGKPESSANMFEDFKKFLRDNELPDIRFHDLRHTSISFLLDMGTPVNTVQQRSGHSKASITTDTYGHSMAHSQDEAAERIEELISPIAVKLQ